VAGIQRHHRIAQMQRSYSYNQVLEREPNSLCFLLALDATRQPRNLKRDRMHGHIPAEPFDKFQPPLPLRLGLGAIGPMH
jgi:hypothetical protein